MRKLLQRTTWSILLCFIVTGSLHAGLDLGGQTLAFESAPPLLEATHIQFATGHQRYLNAVGGVAFDQVAEPVAGFSVGKLELKYRPGAPDGQRLQVTIDGRQYAPHIYDWQLIPTARFADSDHFAAVTMFGKLTNAARAEEVRTRGGEIINYHPAFANSLLGLRIFQLDLLIRRPEATDLPKLNGRYLLGAGEAAPEENTSATAWNQYVAFQSRMSGSGKPYRSYLVCDMAQPAQFGPAGDTLLIEGGLHIFCWNQRSDLPDFEAKETRRRIEQEIRSRGPAGPETDVPTNPVRRYYIDEVLNSAETYERSYSFIREGTVVDLLHVVGTDARRSFLERYATSSLWELLVNLRTQMIAYDVVPATAFTAELDRMSDTLREINPAVWDAGTRLVRFGAFFRYAAREAPDGWHRFLRSIERVNPAPTVRTPTVFLPGKS